MPDDKALVWVVDNGPGRGGQLAYYVSGKIRLQIAREAENAAHPDNLLPVARISLQGMKIGAQALLGWAAALRGQPSAGQWQTELPF